ncbi:unnamed protein product [Nippostrongylus brasiliensis]|uniref:5' exonuclease Apollo n=1 Tax=Nippostrongylus brasiliensis TaxID=27835 RepID=A0A0N4Y529_NIPBR|nr:unnamed protein product [Nippostrongylus brasiliensis]
MSIFLENFKGWSRFTVTSRPGRDDARRARNVGIQICGVNLPRLLFLLQGGFVYGGDGSVLGMVGTRSGRRTSRNLETKNTDLPESSMTCLSPYRHRSGNRKAAKRFRTQSENDENENGGAFNVLAALKLPFPSNGNANIKKELTPSANRSDSKVSRMISSSLEDALDSTRSSDGAEPSASCSYVHSSAAKRERASPPKSTSPQPDRTQNSIQQPPSVSKVVQHAAPAAASEQSDQRADVGASYSTPRKTVARVDDARATQSDDETPPEENLVPKCGKIVIGVHYIAVDRFVRKDQCKFHFLTHAHVDHFVNLNKSWKFPIYCSEMTAKILPHMMGNKALNTRLLRPLKVGETHIIEPNLHVTLLDANHCLGSVMFLFEGASIPGGAILCTGDFRADSRMLSWFDSDCAFQKLSETYISKIYLDNTHLEFDEPAFPERAQCEKILLREMENVRDCSVLFPTYRLGREEIMERLSQSLGEVISTSSTRLAIRKVAGLKGGEFSEENDSEARLRMTTRNPRHVTAALKKMKDPKVIVDLSVRNEYEYSFEEKIIPIPYSDHSSRDEIVAFLSRLRFGELIPTCAPMQCSTAEKLMKLTREKSVPQSPSANAPVLQTDSHRRPAELDEEEAIATTTARLKFLHMAFQPANDHLFEIETKDGGVLDLREMAPLPDPPYVIEPRNPRTLADFVVICDEHGNRI